ncbi:MAG TPA: hypothetical protein VHM19_18305, partial [Polyangiales bacterium]|nr:hypothetical protein [Polyangiales bacterium]
RVGHAYSGRILSFAQHERFEEAIWTALRALREHVDLLLRLGTRSRGMGMNEIALRYDARAGDAQRRVETLQDMLATGVLHDSEDAHLPARDRGQGG